VSEKKIIYLIRHGETEYNRMGVVQGSGIDADLNQKGREQALAFYEKYKSVPFDNIYISKLKRTLQTVQSFIEKGMPYEALEGLNEISWGEKEGKIPNSKDDVIYADLLSAWNNGFTEIAPLGGESPEDVALRQRKALDYILTKSEEKTILIAMHGRAMRILLAQILSVPLSKMDQFHHSNTCLYKLEYNYKTGSFNLLLRNNTDHLLTYHASLTV
jgi:broad specificity phosphatase PhoE